jgi:hypothetical protein
MAISRPEGRGRVQILALLLLTLLWRPLAAAEEVCTEKPSQGASSCQEKAQPLALLNRLKNQPVTPAKKRSPSAKRTPRRKQSRKRVSRRLPAGKPAPSSKP